MSKQTDFFSKYANDAMQAQRLYGVPASVTLAQAALESAWGLSGLTVKANNFFGIKADASWKGELYEALTKEFVNGAYITITSKFRKYKNAAESFNDHALFLKKFNRYKFLFSLDAKDYENWSKGLSTAGYATDPIYASKLINMIVMYKLYEYDIKAFVDPKK